MPSRRPAESRPFRDEPAAFLVAMPRNVVPIFDSLMPDSRNPAAIDAFMLRLQAFQGILERMFTKDLAVLMVQRFSSPGMGAIL